MAEQHISPGVDYVPHHCTFVRESPDDRRGDAIQMSLSLQPLFRSSEFKTFAHRAEANNDKDDDDDATAAAAARRSIGFLSSVGSSRLTAVDRNWPVHCSIPPAGMSYGNNDNDDDDDDDDDNASAAAHTTTPIMSNDYDHLSTSAVLGQRCSSSKGLLPPKKRTKAVASSSSSKSSQKLLSGTRTRGNNGSLFVHEESSSSRPESKYRSRGDANSTLTSSHQCVECQKVFGSAGKLQQHLYVHSGERPFVCGECAKGFSSRFKLMRHALIHAPPGERRYKCPCCERSFHRKDHLKNHAHVHDPNKATYKCLECPKEYNSRLSYRKHVAVHAAHSGDLECKVCLKRFASTEEIIFHLKVHSGSRTIKTPNEKKFKCDFCERRFFTRKDVKRHLVVHTGRRDFLCQICPQRFGRKDHLVRHIKKSHVHHHMHHHRHPLAATASAAAAAAFHKIEKDPVTTCIDADNNADRQGTSGIASSHFRPFSPSLELIFRHPMHCERDGDRQLHESTTSSMFSASVPTTATTTTTMTPSSVSTNPAFLVNSLSMDMEYKLYDDIKIEREHDDPNDIGQLFGFLPLSLSIPPLTHHQHHPLSATLVQQGMSDGHVMQVTSLDPSPVGSTVVEDGDDNALPQFDQAFQ